MMTPQERDPLVVKVSLHGCVDYGLEISSFIRFAHILVRAGK